MGDGLGIFLGDLCFVIWITTGVCLRGESGVSSCSSGCTVGVTVVGYNGDGGVNGLFSSLSEISCGRKTYS